MDKYSLPAAYRRMHDWSFKNRDDFISRRHLIPPHEKRLYDMVYDYKEPSEPDGVAPLPPQAAPAEELPAVPSSSSSSAPPGPVSEYSTDWGGIGSAISTVNTTTPPEDPFTPPPPPPAADTSYFLFQNYMPIPPAEVDFGPTTPHAQAPDEFHPTPRDFSDSGKITLPAVAISAELLERVLSVPTILSVTYVGGQYKGSTNYHYVLPPPPEVDPMHLNGGSVHSGRSMLPVSGDVLVGLPRNTWLDVSMQVVWEEVMISLIGEYALCMNDIGLSAWQWRWVKTEWNMETVSPTTSLKEIIRLFLQTEPAIGAPLILSPVVGAYSNQPCVEFEVPVAPREEWEVLLKSYPKVSAEYLERALMDDINAMEPKRRSPLPYWRPPRDSPMPDDESVESPGTLGHPSPAPPEDIPEEPKRRRTTRRRYASQVVNAQGSGPNLPFPAYWVRTGNAFMVVADTIEECERILNPIGIRCRFVK